MNGTEIDPTGSGHWQRSPFRRRPASRTTRAKTAIAIGALAALPLFTTGIIQVAGAGAASMPAAIAAQRDPGANELPGDGPTQPADTIADRQSPATTPEHTPAPANVPGSITTGIHDPLRIAIALPVTGPRRTLAAAVQQRLSLVKSAIDVQGGIAGHQLMLDIVDDGCSREGAVAMASSLTSQTPPPAVVIGHPCPASALSAATIYQQAGILFIAAGVRHPAFTQPRPGTLVFRAAGRDDRQGSDAGRRLAQLAGPRAAAIIIHDRTVMARKLAAAAALAAAGSTDASQPEVLTIVAGETDYTATIDAIASRKPEAMLFLGFPAEAAIVLRQLRQRGIDIPFLANDAMATAEFVDHAGDLLQGRVEVMMPVSISRDTLQENEMSDALVASDTAAALQLWRDAVTATASSNSAVIAERLASRRSDLEEIAFDRNGDAVTASFAPFVRRGMAWSRAAAPDATAPKTTDAQ